MSISWSNNVVNGLGFTGAIVTAAPITMAAWYKPGSDITTEQCIAVVQKANTPTTNEGWYLEIFSSQVLAMTSDNDNWVHSDKTGVVANTWQHIGAVFASATSRTAYLNGVAATAETSSRTPTAGSINRMFVGAAYNSTSNVFGSPLTGLVADLAIWRAALTTAQLALLAQGASPLQIAQQDLMAYYPFFKENLTCVVNTGFNVILSGDVPLAAQPPGLVVYHSQLGSISRPRSFAPGIIR